MPEVIDENDVTEPQATQEPQQRTQTAPAAQDPEWKQAIADLATHVKTVTAPKKEEPAELTAEQKQELWGVYDPEKGRPDFMRKFFRMNPDATPEEIQEAKDLFADMQKGLVRQSIIGSKNLMEQAMAKLREEFGPLQEYVSSQKAEQTRARFYKKFPVLSDERYGKIIDLTAKGLADKEFASEDDFFKALAESAAETIKAAGAADFELGAAPETKPKPGTTPKLPRTTAGGTGGAGAGGGTKKETSVRDDSASLF